jgi:hypothetical protein
MPYSGPASSYGIIGKAEAAYFAMINDQGGINGRAKHPVAEPLPHVARTNNFLASFSKRSRALS